MMARARHAEHGFTLLEMLVALVVLGFVVAGLSQGLRFGLRATERQERLSNERGDLEAVDRVLRRLVEQMKPGTSRDPTVTIGEAHALDFTTDLGAAASGLSTTQAEARLELLGGRLLLSWRPMLHGVRFGPAPPRQTTVLLDGLDGLDLSYWGPIEGGGMAWQSEWRQRALPLLVRIRLGFRAASGRHWPEIVAAPAAPRPMN